MFEEARNTEDGRIDNRYNWSQSARIQTRGTATRARTVPPDLEPSRFRSPRAPQAQELGREGCIPSLYRPTRSKHAANDSTLRRSNENRAGDVYLRPLLRSHEMLRHLDARLENMVSQGKATCRPPMIVTVSTPSLSSFFVAVFLTV
jgi:hypothetical protein